MKFDPTLVVSPPPLEGSLLGRIVTEQSCREILNEVQLAQLLAALRAQRQHVDHLPVKYRDYVAELHHASESAEEPAPISRTDEPLFASRSSFTIRRDDVVIFDGKTHIVRKSVYRATACDFLVTLENGDSVSSNLVYPITRSEKTCPTLSVEEQIGKILVKCFEKPASNKSLKGLRTETFECLYGEKAIPASEAIATKALPRTTMTPLDHHLDIHELRDEERRQWDKEPRVLTNFSGGVYVQENGKPREEEILNAHEELVTVPRKLLETWKDGPINKNFVEDCWIARIDHRTMVIDVRLEEGQSPKTIAHELGVSLTRVQEAKTHRALSRLSAKCSELGEDAPKVRKGRKPKRHYVRHSAGFIRQQDVNLAIGER